MIQDDILFKRGHINVRIDNRPIDDFDIVIPEYYFEDVLGFTGEVVDSNGTDYELIDLTWDDRFKIKFFVDAVEFETIGGAVHSFEELIVTCEGTVIQIDDSDVLDIMSYVVDVVY